MPPSAYQPYPAGIFGPVTHVRDAMFGKINRPSYPPLEPIFNRRAFGINPVVRRSFETHYSNDPSVGVTGWSFQQSDMIYGFSYEASTDLSRKYDFAVIVEVPEDRPYLHPSDEMGLAERAHIVGVIQTMLDPFQKTQLSDMFFEFEKACSMGGVEAYVDRYGASHLNPIRQNETRIHYGTVFPNDDDYLDLPKENILCIEWNARGFTHSVHCSEGFPAFYVERTGRKSNDRMYMNQSEAETAIRHIRDVTRNDTKFNNIAMRMHLFPLMEYGVAFLSENRVPAPSGP